MENHSILSERLEDQLEAVEWAKKEQERLLKEKGELLTQKFEQELAPFILQQYQIHCDRSKFIGE